MDEFEKIEQPVEEAVSENEILETEENAESVEVGETTEEAVEPVADEAIESAAEEVTEPAKKKTKVQTPIIIAACILVVAVLGFLCFRMFFNTSIVGTWVLESEASADQASDGGNTTTYYTFNNDGTASLTLGTMKVVGTWNYTSSDGSTADQTSDSIYVAISYFFNGQYQFEVTGNEFAGRKLTLKSGENSYDFVAKSIPRSNLKPAEDFKANDKVTGKWKNEDNNITYEFNADGTCHINQMDQLFIDGVYTIEDGKFNITYEPQNEATTIEYSVKGSKMTISGLEYKKVTE